MESVMKCGIDHNDCDIWNRNDDDFGCHDCPFNK